jgi:hypothetical protein
MWEIGNQITYLLSRFLIHIISALSYGAGDGTRTRNLLITNQLLCQLSYTSMATQKGLEPSTSSVTGWHSNQLNYWANYKYQRLATDVIRRLTSDI